jgi:hypothetical protein
MKRGIVMDDLISRAAAIEEIARRDTTDGTVKVYSGREINAILSDLPAVDAVPVVRCRDCKFGEQDTTAAGIDIVMCQNKHNPIGFEYWLMSPEFFCADGERRDT